MSETLLEAILNGLNVQKDIEFHNRFQLMTNNDDLPCVLDMATDTLYSYGECLIVILDFINRKVK